MHREQRPVHLFAEPEKGGPQERPPGEVKWPQGFLTGQPHRLRIARPPFKPRELDQGHRHCQSARLGRHHLRRLAVEHGEARAERRVAPHDLAEARRERLRVEPTAQFERPRQVVGGAPGLQLIEKPEPLLGEGERRRRSTWGSGEEGRGGVRSGERHGDLGGESGDRRPLEQATERQLDAERLAYPGHDLGRQERMPAESEEVLLDPHPVFVEHRGPDPHHQGLDFVPG